MGSSIRENLDHIRANIEKAALRAGRDPRGVTLIAVTKTVDASAVNEAVALGVSDIGESRIQDAARKFPSIVPGIRWHLIGHLQTNKVKEALCIFDCVHSVDSIRLACEISRRAAQSSRTVSVLLEVNVSGEAAKYGFREEEAEEALQEIAVLPALTVTGLMTMAPLSDDPERSRPVFRRLRELRDRLNALKAAPPMAHLSMGMSQDYEAAVEEGATYVRIGSALFSSN